MDNRGLPIGSVVLLRRTTRKLMIIGGAMFRDGDPSQRYDYVGVPYPEGFVGPRYTVLFRAEDINDVMFRGYDSEEQKAFAAVMDLSEQLMAQQQTEE